MNPGERAIRWISRLTLCDDFAGQPFDLRPWQADIIRKVYGTVGKDGLRQYRQCFLALPRKQAKTQLAAAMATFDLLGSGREGQQVLIAASDREQASHLYRKVVSMIEADSYLASKVVTYSTSKRIVTKKGNNILQVLSSDGRRQHGWNPSSVYVDECHTQPNRELWDVLTSGFGARKDPLTVAISTAGSNRYSLCWELWDYALKVRDGVIDDPTFLPILYAADPEADWTDEKTWFKAMPALGDFCSLEFIRKECKLAQELPARENAFRRLYLNQWTTTDAKWLSLEAWDALKSIIIPRDLEGMTCFAALDLSSTTDLTCLCLVFPMDDGTYKVMIFFFVPSDSAIARAKRDKVPYPDWIKAGIVIESEGNVTDYEAIRKCVSDLSDVYRFEKLGIDPWNAQQLCNQLATDGQDVVEYRQNYANLSPPAKELERLILSRRIHHDGNECLRWCVSNCSIEQDASGNIRPSKRKSNERIDGVVSLVMAIGLATSTKPPGEASISFFQ